MHPFVMTFVADAVERYDLAGKSTLEVGSMNVNGSPRRFFNGHYVGVLASAADVYGGVQVAHAAHELQQAGQQLQSLSQQR